MRGDCDAFANPWSFRMAMLSSSSCFNRVVDRGVGLGCGQCDVAPL